MYALKFKRMTHLSSLILKPEPDGRFKTFSIQYQTIRLVRQLPLCDILYKIFDFNLIYCESNETTNCSTIEFSFYACAVICS